MAPVARVVAGLNVVARDAPDIDYLLVVSVVLGIAAAMSTGACKIAVDCHRDTID